MNPETVVIAVAVCVAIVGYMVWLTRKLIGQQKAREKFAAERGWSYRVSDLRLPRELRGEPFEGAWQGHTSSIMEGYYRGVPARAFEFTCKRAMLAPLGGNDPARIDDDHVAYGVVNVWLPIAVPTVQVKPEGVGTQLKAVFGVHDVALGNPAFDRMFHVTAPDPRAAPVLHPGLQQWLLADPRFVDHPFRIDGDQIITWWAGSLEPDLIASMLDFCLDIAAQLPPWTAQAGQR